MTRSAVQVLRGGDAGWLGTVVVGTETGGAGALWLHLTTPPSVPEASLRQAGAMRL